jgi:Replication-relaxation
VEALRELTDRDRYLLAVLAEHQVLTADQIGRLKFTDAYTDRKRLVLLTRRGILDRFRDAVRPGSQPGRYTLGSARRRDRRRRPRVLP